MTTFVVLGMASFEGDQASADHIFNQARSVAVMSSVSRIGTPGERASYFGVYEEQADGSLVPVKFWSKDIFGIVRDGAVDSSAAPAWIQPSGAQDAYPLLNVRGEPARVSHNGKTWTNTTAGNIWEPGVYGWTDDAS